MEASMSNISKLVRKAERRVEVLKLQRDILALNAKLEILDFCLLLYPPQAARENGASASLD